MPSLRHEFLARVLPALRKSRDIDTGERERARIEAWHRQLAEQAGGLPTNAVALTQRAFDRRFTVDTEPCGDFTAYVVTPRRLLRDGQRPTRTLYWVHGGGFTAPIDPFHVRYGARLAAAIGARLVLPDYPLTPEHTWRDTIPAITEHVASFASRGELVLGGDSAGGGIALAVAQQLRDKHPDATPTHLLMHAPWVDLTTSTPETYERDADDPWLFLGKLLEYAKWWAGGEEHLGRPECSPALADLDGLPRALMFCGTRDLLNPGCRLLADRAAASDWDLTYIERPGLLHVFALLPGIPEARRAWQVTLPFLG